MKSFLAQKLIFFAVLILAAVAGVFVVRQVYPYDVLSVELWAVTGFFGLFGALYAIIAGFTIYIARLRFLELSALSEKELNELEVIRDSVNIYLANNPGRSAILRSLAAYVDSVILKDWPKMSVSGPIDSDTSPELFTLMKSVDTVRSHDHNDEAVITQLIERLGKITEFRTERLNLVQENLPTPLSLLLIIMSAIIIMASLLTAVKDLFINLFIVSSTTLSAWLVYYIISDLDNPFVGFWNVSDANFRKFSDSLKKLIANA